MRNFLLRAMTFTLLITPTGAYAASYIAACHASSWREEVIFLEAPMMSWVIALNDQTSELTWIDSNGAGIAECDLSFLSAKCPIADASIEINIKSGVFLIVASKGDVVTEARCKAAALYDILPR